MLKPAKKIRDSKLKEKKTISSNKITGDDKTAKQPKLKEYPRSYRLDAELMSTLNDTLARVNKISPKKVKEARLVKALILLSKELDENIILKAVKEVW